MQTTTGLVTFTLQRWSEGRRHIVSCVICGGRFLAVPNRLVAFAAVGGWPADAPKVVGPACRACALNGPADARVCLEDRWDEITVVPLPDDERTALTLDSPKARREIGTLERLYRLPKPEEMECPVSAPCARTKGGRKSTTRSSAAPRTDA